MPLEYHIVFVLCIAIAAIVIPHAIMHHSVTGWVAGGICLAAITAQTVAGICSRTGPPSYDGFLAGVFFFIVLLGLTAGIFAGALQHSLTTGLAGSAAGLVLGYALGILAGLGFQYLGWLAGWLDMLAGVGVIGLIVLDLVLLFG